MFDPARHDDACLCRFLRARKWDMGATETMFTEAETWRKEYKVEELYNSFEYPEKAEVNKLYPQFYHKVDREGRPIYIEQLGALDLKKLFQVTTPERLIQQLVVEYEKLQRERLPVCSEDHQELIETSCTIMDLKNVGIGQFWKVSSYVQQASKIGQYYYPETMGRFYIINAPYIFTTVWAVVKNWLDPVTTSKISILGGGYISELEKQLDLENLPEEIGGKCRCPEGCSLSDAGPWKTPEGQRVIERVKEEKERVRREYFEGTGKKDGDDSSQTKETKHAAPAAQTHGKEDQGSAEDDQKQDAQSGAKHAAQPVAQPASETNAAAVEPALQPAQMDASVETPADANLTQGGQPVSAAQTLDVHDANEGKPAPAIATQMP